MLHISGLHGGETNRTEHKLDPDSEQARKLQKGVHEIIRRIDNHHHKADHASQVFSSDLVGLRVRLRDYTHKLFHLKPEAYGVKYLDLEWRKAWHEPVSLARNVGGPEAKILLEHHLQAGIGQYHHFILSLQYRYGSIKGVQLDWNSGASYGFSQASSSKSTQLRSPTFGLQSSDEKKEENKWMVEIVAKCLIWLGDLNRYRLEILEDNSNYGIDALFFYMKCLTSRIKFEGGEANLLRFAGKHRTDDSPYSAASHKIIQMVVQTIKKDKEESVIALCQESLGYLHQLTTEGKVENDVWLTRACASVILTIIQLEGSTGNEIGLCQAWLLALCSHITGALVHFLGTSLHGPTWTEQDLSTEDLEMEEKINSEENNEKEKSEAKTNGKTGEKKKRKKLTDLLRRRKISNSGSSRENSELSEDEISDEERGERIGKRRGNLSDSDNEGDESVGDETESDEDSLAHSDEMYFLSDSEDEDFSFDDKSDSEDVVIEEENDILQTDKDEKPSTRFLVELIIQSGLLPALHLCLLWLRAQPTILSGLQVGVQDEATSFWTRLARIFTLLNLDSSIGAAARYTSSENIDIIYESCRENMENKKIWLEEFWSVRGCSMFESQLKDVDWEQTADNQLQGTVTRLVYLESWRNWLVSLDGTKDGCPEEGRAVIVEPSSNNNETEKKCVMKHMAELWLKEEVTNLEQTKGDQHAILVVDSMALLQDLQMVRRVAGYKKFKMVVPQVVIRELDNIKKQDKNARQSIRWLERELSRGHKGILAQESHQKNKVNMIPPNRKSPEWSKFQVLKCIAYQVEQVCNENKEYQVVFLTGDPEIIQQLDADVTKVTKELNVRVEAITNFMERFLGGAAPPYNPNIKQQRHHHRHQNGGRRNWSRDSQDNRSRDKSGGRGGSRDSRVRSRDWRHNSSAKNGDKTHRRDDAINILTHRIDRDTSGDRGGGKGQGSGGG